MIEITHATIRVVGTEGMEAWERLQKEFGSLIHIHYSDITYVGAEDE